MTVDWKYRDLPDPEERRLRLFIDCDLDKGVPHALDLSREETHALVRMDVMYLREKYGLGRAEIYESEGGFMVRFPDSEMSPSDLVGVLWDSVSVDPGYAYWAIRWGGIQTLRTGPKKIVEVNEGKKLGTRTDGSEPKLVEVIE